MCYMCNNESMRTSGLREARQKLADLIEEVKKGREIVLTDRGRAVARLVPPAGPEGKGLPDLASFRAAQPRLSWSLSDLIAADRDDRV
jgi:prevent-host-death family protein